MTMADNFLQFSESLDSLTPAEADWLREQLAEDPIANCPRFLLDFTDREADDTDYGFQYEFEGDSNDRHLWISAEERGDVERVAHLIQKFLRRFRPDQCWSLTYATTCSKLRLGEFGGGAAFVTVDDIRWNDSYDFVAEQGKALERRQQHDLRPVAKSDLRSYALRIDGDLLRKQRRLLLTLVDSAHRNVPDVPKARGETELLEGILALLDEIADQAHDQYGIDCLLNEQAEEPQGQAGNLGPQGA
jgi:hypothetical protein